MLYKCAEKCEPHTELAPNMHTHTWADSDEEQKANSYCNSQQIDTMARDMSADADAGADKRQIEPGWVAVRGHAASAEPAEQAKKAKRSSRRAIGKQRACNEAAARTVRTGRQSWLANREPRI